MNNFAKADTLSATDLVYFKDIQRVGEELLMTIRSNPNMTFAENTASRIESEIRFLFAICKFQN